MIRTAEECGVLLIVEIYLVAINFVDVIRRVVFKLILP